MSLCICFLWIWFCFVSQSLLFQISNPVGESKVYNGYTLFCAHAFKERTLQPGESYDSCRRRTLNWCKEQWKNNPALKAFWGNAARQHNLEAKEKRKQRMQLANLDEKVSVSTPKTSNFNPTSHPLSMLVQHVYDSDDDDDEENSQAIVLHHDDDVSTQGRFKQLVAIPKSVLEANTDQGDHFGAFGLGDGNWALSEHAVHQADMEDGFVRKWASKWRERASGIIPDPGQFASTSFELWAEVRFLHEGDTMHGYIQSYFDSTETTCFQSPQTSLEEW